MYNVKFIYRFYYIDNRNPFPTTVYIGHPGWKSIGAGIGYTFVTGLSVFIISLFGLGGLFLGLIPLSAVFPYTGVIHSVSVGWALQPGITVGYLLIAAVFVYKYFVEKKGSDIEVITGPDQTA